MQLSIVGCVDVDTASVYEHFLTFTEAATQNAESLCTLILQTLDTFKFNCLSGLQWGIGYERSLFGCAAAGQASYTPSSVCALLCPQFKSCTGGYC